MAIRDALLYLGEFTPSGDVGGGNGSAVFPVTVAANTLLDLKQRQDFADGNTPLFFEVVVSQAFAVGAGTPALQIGVFTCDDTSGTNLFVHYICGGAQLAQIGGGTGPFLPYSVASELTLNRHIYLPMPRAWMIGTVASTGVPTTFQRYMGVNFWQPAWSGSYFSAGKMKVSLVSDLPTFDKGKAFPDGVR